MGESTPRRPTQEPRTNAANYLTPLAADIPFERVETNDSEFSTHTHDSTGKPLPHYEGPYYVEYQEDGTRVEKRWCKFDFYLPCDDEREVYIYCVECIVTRPVNPLPLLV